MKLFTKIVNYKKSTISPKSSILDVWLGCEYVSASYFQGTFQILLGRKFHREKIGWIKEWTFANVCETLPKKTIAFTKKKYLKEK